MKLTLSGITFNVECPQLDTLEAKLDTILKKERQIMASLDEVKALVQNGIDKIDALNTALDGYREVVATLKTQLEELQSGAKLAPAVQTKVDEIMASLTTEVAKIDETFVENFPPDIPPIPEA